MELIVKNKTRNELLKREEISAVIKSVLTPSIRETKKAVAENLKKSEECVVVKRVKGNFGRKEFNVDAYAYDSKEAMEKIEPKPKVKKQEQEGQQTNEVKVPQPEATKKKEELKTEQK